MIVIGIDSGSRWLGVGVLDCARGRRPSLVAAETITADPKLPRTDRLRLMAVELREMFAEYRPALVGIEDAFVARKPNQFRGSLAVAEARGVVIACVPAEVRIVRSFPPPTVKASIGCKGNAEKAAVAARIGLLFDLRRTLEENAADATAVAWAMAAHAGLVA